MFNLTRFTVLEEDTAPAEPGTYPDDRAHGDAVKTTICEWVQLVVDPCASEAKRDEAFGLLLFTHLLLGSTGAELLWPFLLGTLLRRADAREASKDPGHDDDDDKDGDDVRGEVKLVQLLRLGGLVRHSYAAWLPRLLAIVVSGKTPDVLKVALLEHLAINRVTPNSTKLATSLVEAVVKPATTSDKVRACAIFAVGSLLHRHTGNEQLRTTWADLFYNRTDEEQAAVRFGLLAHTAMAWVAVHHLGDQAPDAAVSQAVYALAHDVEFLSAWSVIEGGDALLQPRGLSSVAVAELLDLEKASLSDMHEKLRHEVNIGSRVSLETATVPWPSLKSFDEFFIGPLIKLKSGRAKQLLVACLLDQLGLSSSDRAIQRLVSCLMAVTLPSAFAEGTVRQEVERDNPDALGVLRRLADEPQFDHLWHWIGRQEDTEEQRQQKRLKPFQLGRGQSSDFEWDSKGLPLTTRADLQRFFDAPLPAHWSTGKWMPDLTGLDDEDWIGQQVNEDTCAPVIRDLASRCEDVQRMATMRLVLQWQGVHAAKLAIKWGAKLIGYQRVINKALLIERLLIACAVASHTPTTFRVAGFDSKCLPPTGSLHDEVGQYMRDYLEILRDVDEPESVRTPILNLIAMFPEHWSVTLPHVAAVFHSAAESLSLRATALSTFSFIVPVTPDSWQACSHEEREQVRQAIAELSSFLPPLHGVVSLRDVAASALASSQVGKHNGYDWEGLPEELRGLMERKAWACAENNEPYRHLQMSAALGMCRLLLRAHSVVGSDTAVSSKQAAPIEWSVVMSELELELSAWLPSIKSVLHAGLAEGRSGADLGRTYLRLLFGRDALDELVALLLVALREGGEDLTPVRAMEMAREIVEQCFMDHTPAPPTPIGVVHGVRPVPLTEERAEILRIFVRCDALWVQDDGTTLMRLVQGHLQGHVPFDRPALASFLGVQEYNTWPGRKV